MWYLGLVVLEKGEISIFFLFLRVNSKLNSANCHSFCFYGFLNLYISLPIFTLQILYIEILFPSGLSGSIYSWAYPTGWCSFSFCVPPLSPLRLPLALALRVICLSLFDLTPFVNMYTYRTLVYILGSVIDPELQTLKSNAWFYFPEFLVVISLVFS